MFNHRISIWIYKIYVKNRQQTRIEFAIHKKEETHRMVEANGAFTHFQSTASARHYFSELHCDK